MAVITPVWTDGIVVVPPTKLSAGGAGWVRGTIDLRGKNGAYLFAKLGRLTAVVLATPIDVYVRRVLNNGVVNTNLPFTHPSAPYFLSQVAVSTATTVSTNAVAGDKTLVLAAGAGFVKGDAICISDSGLASFGRTEFNIVSKLVTNTLTLANPLNYDHTAAQADVVTRLADVWAPIPLQSGSLYEVIFDYQVSATGGDIVVMAHAQTYDSDLGT